MRLNALNKLCVAAVRLNALNKLLSMLGMLHNVISTLYLCICVPNAYPTKIVLHIHCNHTLLHARFVHTPGQSKSTHLTHTM